MRRPAALFWLVAAATVLAFLFSRLFFTPVPWPDGSAFYLPGRDLVAWPPLWHMHTQAAFVPSYDRANFNTMPLLPLLLGLGARLGLASLLGATFFTRALSLIPLVGAAWTLWRWAQDALTRSERPWSARAAKLAAWTLALALLWDPVNRWGTLVVRTETWIGWLWILCLRDLHRLSRRELDEKRALWRISLWLALAAGFHFEAIILVPATLIGLLGGDWRAAWRRWRGVGLRTALLLSPWLLYVLLHLPLFAEQMHTQFFRLQHENRLIRDAYSIFHSLFIAHGSAVSWPKFFNLAKGILWALILASLFLTARGRSRVAWAAAAFFLASMDLWFRKPEIWFITLCHLACWPWLLTLLAEGTWARGRAGRILLAGAGAYAVISILATGAQERQIPRAYSRTTYRRWIDCIEKTAVEAHPGKADSVRLWQPHVPDALIELRERRPGWDLTRALDFEAEIARAWELTTRLDVLLYSRFDSSFIAEYEGEPRAQDTRLLADGLEVPFGPWYLERFPKEQPGAWRMRVCQVGPFWAALALRGTASGR